MSKVQLFIFTTFCKEVDKLNRALQAIAEVQNLALIGPLLPQVIIVNNRSLLRLLTVIGEAYTQINLTPQSRSLSGLSQRDFQLFKKIRDKLAHGEWDIHSNHIESYIQANNMNAFKVELNILVAELTIIIQQLNHYRQNNQLAAHYNNNALAPAAQYLPGGGAVHVERFPTVRAFLNILVQDAASLGQDKIQYPEEFTPLAMANKIQEELQYIRDLTNQIPGHGTLNDPHEENKHVILNQGNPTLIQLIQQENINQHDLGLTQALQVIQAINPINPQGILLIEIAAGIIAPHFNPQANPNGMPVNINVQFIQNNFANISEAFKQYARKLEFINYLQNHLNIRRAIEYHIGRIIKFLDEIPQADLFHLVSQIQAAEWRVLRNIIQHDVSEIDITGIPMEAFICHYLAPITCVLPNMLQPLYEHGPFLAP